MWGVWGQSFGQISDGSQESPWGVWGQSFGSIAEVSTSNEVTAAFNLGELSFSCTINNIKTDLVGVFTDETNVNQITYSTNVMQ